MTNMLHGRSSLDEIETRAAQWILKRDRGELSPEDRAALETWLAADAEHRAAYLRLSEAWDVSAGLKAWRPVDGSIDLTVLAPSQSSSRQPTREGRKAATWRVAWFTAAASVVLAVVFGWRLMDVGATQIYVTDVGGYQRVLLEDGSILQLNTDTEVRVRFHEDRRELTLARGEAYFKVAHDPSRPFEVAANGTVVRAVGTAFSIRLRDTQKIEVVVTEGKVALQHDLPNAIEKAFSSAKVEVAQPSFLVAGETAEATTQDINVARVEKHELDRRLAWQAGELRFQQASLETVIAEFNRYSRQRVEIADPQLAQREIGGAFKSTDVDSFLAAMQSALDVRIERDDDVVRLYAN